MASAARDPTAPFSLQEFSDLVCTAFNLASQQHPRFSLRPPSPSAGPSPHSPSSSYFDTDTDDDHIAPYIPDSARATSHSKRTSSQPPKHRSSALTVLKNVRTRASALVLRPSNTNISHNDASDASLLAVPSLPRPSVSSQRTVLTTASSFAFLSRPHTPCPTTRPSSPFPFVPGADLALSRSRSRTKSLPGPISLLKLGRKRVAPATISAVQQPAPRPDLPSFFEDSGYSERPHASAYSRPVTPVIPPLPARRVHARLPPLRKAKSASTSLFRGKGAKAHLAKNTDPAAPSTGVHANTNSNAQMETEGEWSFGEGDFVMPREPPPVPVALRGLGVRWEESEDSEGLLLEVPGYVFERRGSATSTCTSSTMTSTKSTSSLGERIASLLPLSLPSKAKFRARSKLSLAITTATADSSPSTDSTRTWSPVTPTGYAFPPPGTDAGPGQCRSQSEHGHAPDCEETCEDAYTVGRVLTPEPDPFKKASIEIEKVGVVDVTPTPAARSGTPVLILGSTRRGLGLDLDGADGIAGLDGPGARWRAAGRFSRTVTRRIPPAASMFDESTPASPAYTFPSSCSVYRDVDELNEEDREGEAYGVPVTPTSEVVPVSRFSTPSSSVSSRSSYEQFEDEEEGEEERGVDVDADVDVTFVFGFPQSAGGTEERNGETVERRRISMDAISSASPPRPRIAARASLPPSPPSATLLYSHSLSPPSSPSKHSKHAYASLPSSSPQSRYSHPSPPPSPSPAHSKIMRASLPPTPPSSHSRYMHAQYVPESPTKRKSSVRTVASEPAARIHRPDSPFPLMRGLSDGSPRGKLRKQGRISKRQKAQDGVSRLDAEEDSADSGFDAADFVDDSGIMVDFHGEDALEDSFVLPQPEAAKLLIQTEDSDQGSEPSTPSDEVAQDRLTPRPPSQTGSCVHLQVCNSLHAQSLSVDSNATITPQRYRSSLMHDNTVSTCDEPLSGASVEEAKNEPEWDRRTAFSMKRTTQSSTRSSMFYSARSSVGSAVSVRKSV